VGDHLGDVGDRPDVVSDPELTAASMIVAACSKAAVETRKVANVPG
jgi:hypothetical protein